MWTGSPVPRRQVVALDRCNQCHGRLTAHGARNQPEYCVLCHAADRTDWSRRPKRTDKNVNLAIPYGNVLGTYDNREERTVHLKVMLHRLHTGEATGVVGLQAAAPHLIYGSPVFLDDVRFPNALSNCLLCHVDGSYLIEAVPATAPRTVANETASILHSATALHAASEAGVGPIQSACMSCHDTGPGRSHAASNTVGGVEGCVTCHGGSSGTLSVPKAHGLVP